MMLLGIDPGAVHIGWCVLRDGQFHDSGYLALGKWDKTRTLHTLRGHIEALLEEFAPDVVAIEETQYSARADKEASGGAAFAKGLYTQRTESVAAEIAHLAGKAGAELRRVHPATGLRALGVKRGCTDGTCAKAYTLLTGRKLLAKHHHEARALGVALAAEKQVRIGKAGLR